MARFSCMSGRCQLPPCPIVNSAVPIVGGYFAVGLPPNAPDTLVRAHKTHKFQALSNNTKSWFDPIEQIFNVLDTNGVESVSETDVLRWVYAQYYERDPDRFLKEHVPFVQGRGGGTTYKFNNFDKKSVEFWNWWSELFSDTDLNPQAVVSAFVAAATVFLSSATLGCPEICAKNLPDHLEKFPPENVYTMLHAQAWLWHIHNLSRNGRKPYPFHLAARQHGWALMAQAQVNGYLTEIKA